MAKTKFKDTPKIVMHANSKYNKLNYSGFCTMCLEYSTFRHVLFDGVNSIMCVRCLTAKPLQKGLKSAVIYMYKDKLAPGDKWARVWIRVKAFFKGKHKRKRFDFRILRGK